MAICKKMFSFRSQLQMVKSCFCLCLKSTLDFHTLCFPFCIWLLALLFVLSQGLQMRSSGFPVVQVVGWALAVVISAWPQQPLAVSSWCGTAELPTATWLNKDVLPRAGGAAGAVHQHGNRTAGITLGCVLFLLRAYPSDPGGLSRESAASGKCFPSPGEEPDGLLEFIAPMTHCCDRQHMMSLSCFIC